MLRKNITIQSKNNFKTTYKLIFEKLFTIEKAGRQDFPLMIDINLGPSMYTISMGVVDLHNQFIQFLPYYDYQCHYLLTSKKYKLVELKKNMQIIIPITKIKWEILRLVLKLLIIMIFFIISILEDFIKIVLKVEQSSFSLNFFCFSFENIIFYTY